MGSHHDNHHSNEQKPVSFTVPFILAVVTLTAILSLVSLGDPCHCKETCEAGHGTEAHGDHGHGAAAGHEDKAHGTEAVKEEAPAAEVKHDSAAAAPAEASAAHGEEKKEEAHH